MRSMYQTRQRGVIGVIFGGLMGFVFWLFMIWCIWSGIASGVKAIADDCGEEYFVEAVLSADFFCPVE